MDSLARIEEAADELRQRLSAAELARSLRRVTSTITRRGEIRCP
jgi:IS30 family transposase